MLAATTADIAWSLFWLVFLAAWLLASVAVAVQLLRWSRLRGGGWWTVLGIALIAGMVVLPFLGLPAAAIVYLVVARGELRAVKSPVSAT